MSNKVSWDDLNRAARTALIQAGYAVAKAPGHGGANVWMLTRDGTSVRASIRTTRDRWFAFVPQNKGKTFKTLDEVDVVVVATVDHPKQPGRYEVFLFPAEEVRRSFSAAYAVRSEARHALPDDRGMWVSLDRRDGDSPSNVGSGLIDRRPAIGSWPINGEQIPQSREAPVTANAPSPPVEAETIADVVVIARQRIASLAGVQIDAVKIDLKIEY